MNIILFFENAKFIKIVLNYLQIVSLNGKLFTGINWNSLRIDTVVYPSKIY
jgi:hypothetical protein